MYIFVKIVEFLLSFPRVPEIPSSSIKILHKDSDNYLKNNKIFLINKKKTCFFGLRSDIWQIIQHAFLMKIL